MPSRLRRPLLILAILLLAVVLRETAARRLPVDFDEPTYFAAGQRYAAALRDGDLRRLVDDPTTAEHPGLVKLLYAAVFLRRPPPPVDPAAYLPPPLAPDPDGLLLPTRRASVVPGALHVLLLAAVNPAAGALLAVHSYAVKYTAQVYLEALPMLAASVCVLAYARAERRSRHGRASLLLWTISAVALGLTAAGKYVYAVAGLAVAADWLWAAATARRPQRLLGLAAWGGLALLVFYAADPYLWPDPIGRLSASLAFHAAYSQSAHVASSGYPPWQPFVWLLTPQPARWHPGVILVPLDTLTALLGVAGVGVTWRRGGRVIVLWWLIGLAFTLAWPTKWPQYSLVMTAPMCLCAGEAARGLARQAARRAAPPRAGSVNPG